MRLCERLCERLCVSECVSECVSVCDCVYDIVWLQVESYMLIRHVRELLRHPVDPSALTDSAPLVVLNNFGGGGGKHIALMTSMLQGMFPTIDIGTVRLSSCQRVVLFHMDKVPCLLSPARILQVSGVGTVRAWSGEACGLRHGRRQWIPPPRVETLRACACSHLAVLV